MERLVPEYIKLDRSTVVRAVDSERFRTILRNLLVGLRHCVTGGIIAEGIESPEEFQVVKAMGIDFVQGYLLGTPLEITPAGVDLQRKAS